MEKDDLIRVLSCVVVDANSGYITALEDILNEPSRVDSRHGELAWFRILKERLNP